MFIRLARYLDQKRLLNFNVWEFSLRNVTRFYPYYYLFFVLLRRPVAAMKGFQQYLRLAKNSDQQPLPGNSSPEVVLPSGPDGDLVIGPGFCLKPWDDVRKTSLCPAGQFNHRCLLLESPETLYNSKNEPRPPCNTCTIAKLGEMAAQCGASIYIMTSGFDIARDLFKPALTNAGPRTGLFFLCAYSNNAFTFGMCTSGIRGANINFCRGDCRNHLDFTKADVGIKPEQTEIAPTDWEAVTRLLPGGQRIPDGTFEYRNHVYINKRTRPNRAAKRSIP